MSEEKPRTQLLQRGTRWIILRKGNAITAILRSKRRYSNKMDRYEGVAMCHVELDTFDEEFGKELAKTRALVKYENAAIAQLRRDLKIYDEILEERAITEKQLKSRLASRTRLHKKLRELVPPAENK